MLVSYNWLKQYVDLPASLTAEELALQLTMSTVEVEGVKNMGKELANVVVGEVKELNKHPNAGKLQLAVVSDGKKDYQVVCGGSNLQLGMQVALAKVGAQVRWHGEGELVKLEKAKIRGEESLGMICAATEISLGELFPQKDEKEILDLSALKLKVGQSLAAALGLADVVFDIDNKSMTHRPDLWGHYGLAREIAALTNHKLKDLELLDLKESKGVDLKIKIEDKENCLRYIGAVVGGIKIEPSPDWMQSHLLACGVRPINNIVDITNYVTLELGRPSHAFDRRDIAKDTIIVRRAKKGEKFTTLDGQKRTMTEQMSLVCDAKGPVDLAGIMGGENSEVKDDTTEIILELANFNSANIRRTSTALGLRTEAGMRFEKDLSPYLAELGMQRILTLIKQLLPEAKLLSKIVDVNHHKKENREIELDLVFLNMKVGQDIPKKEVINILAGLGFTVKDKKDRLLVTVPEWRSVKDISLPEDLVEEVARIYGYDNIITQLPTFPVIPPEKNELRLLERKVKDILALEYDYTEVYNYSFVAPDWCQKMGVDLKDLIELDNPIAKDRPYLRHSLWPGLLENVEKNLHYIDNLKLFEIGQVFVKDQPGQPITTNSKELLPKQDYILSLAYAAKGEKIPFYEVSAAVVGLLEKLGYDCELKSKDKLKEKLIHPGRQARVYVNGKNIARVVEINPAIQVSLGIDERTALAELNLTELLKLEEVENNYQSLAQYPEVLRDVAFVVDRKVQHDEIVKVLEKVDELVRGVELFDVFVGGKVGGNKKSLAYHISYRSDDKTLASSDIDKIHEKLIKQLEKEFKAEVRK